MALYWLWPADGVIVPVRGGGQAWRILRRGHRRLRHEVARRRTVRRAQSISCRVSSKSTAPSAERRHGGEATVTPRTVSPRVVDVSSQISDLFGNVRGAGGVRGCGPDRSRPRVQRACDGRDRQARPPRRKFNRRIRAALNVGPTRSSIFSARSTRRVGSRTRRGASGSRPCFSGTLPARRLERTLETLLRVQTSDTVNLESLMLLAPTPYLARVRHRPVRASYGCRRPVSAQPVNGARGHPILARVLARQPAKKKKILSARDGRPVRGFGIETAAISRGMPIGRNPCWRV